MNKQEYRVYLRSPAWKRRREKALLRAHHQCQICKRRFRFGRGGELEVHLTYERVGREIDSDLTVLCRECHDAEHGHPDKRRQPLSVNESQEAVREWRVKAKMRPKWA